MSLEIMDEHGEARSAGRPRCTKTRQRILDAAFEVLKEKGMAGFSIEAVAHRAGSAKTTIYRWWPSKGALAVEAYFQAMGPLLPLSDDTASPADDLRAQLRGLAAALNSPLGTILGDLIAEGQSNPETAEALRTGYLQPRRAMMRKVLERGIAQGHFRADIDFGVALDALFGAVAGRALLWGRPLDPAWVDRLVDTVYRGLLTAPAKSAA